MKDDDVSIQIGILLGAEWTSADIGLHLGLSASAINHRRQTLRHKRVIETVRGWTSVAISKYIEKRLEKAEEAMNERKKRIHEKGYKVIEKTLDNALASEEKAAEVDQPWLPDGVHLRAAEMGIERTEGKPLDRKAILQRDEHVYRVEVDGGDLEGILAEVAQLNEMRRGLLQLNPAPDTSVAEKPQR